MDIFASGYKKNIGYIKLVIVILIWGGSYHVAKYMIQFSDIVTISFFRFLIASFFLFAMLFRNNDSRKSFISKPTNHWLLLFMIGLIGVFTYNIAFFGAETLVSANNVAILFSFTPCLTIILGRIFLRQKLNILGYLGIILALLGSVAVIVLSGNDCSRQFCGLLDSLSVGDILALSAALAMASYNLLNKVAAQINITPMAVTTYSSFFGTIFLGIAFLFYGSISNLYDKPWLFWVALFYMAVLATVVCFKWYNEAISEIGVARASIFQSGVPVSAVFIGIVFLNESVSAGVIMAGIVVIAGVLITNVSLSRT